MNPWIAKSVIILACAAMIVIRAPHGQRSLRIAVVKSRKGALETFVLGMSFSAFLVPIVWVVAPVFSFAEYALHPLPFVAGSAGLVAGLWLFHRAHADLGTNWSITLEVRDQQRLVTEGLYRRIRHPMYAALLLYGVGQALVVPNWLAGPSYAVAMLSLVALRVGPEERMMLDEFGKDYEAYRTRTKRLIPGVW